MHDTLAPLKNRIQSEDTATSLLTLQKGQLWELKDSSLQINLVGKTLVHYKQFKGKLPKGTPVSITAIKVLEKYLEKNKAVLVK